MAGTPFMVKLFLNAHASVYKLTGGSLGGRMGPNRILLLTTTGRKSGQKHTIPLGFIQDGEDFVVTASNGGGPQNPGWYFNLKANPQAQIQVGNRQLNVTAVQADPEQKKSLWAQLISVSPQYDGYRTRTSRDIPMMILHPNS